MSRARLATLEQYLLQYFSAPPDAATVADIAALYCTTPEAVQTAVRRFVPQGPISERPVDAEPSRPRGFDAVVSAFRQHGHVLKATKKGFVTRCPLHQDRRPSMIINRAPDDARVALLHCHSCKKKPGQLLASVGPYCPRTSLTSYYAADR